MAAEGPGEGEVLPPELPPPCGRNTGNWSNGDLGLFALAGALPADDDATGCSTRAGGLRVGGSGTAGRGTTGEMGAREASGTESPTAA